jgi:hypothetical protein
MTFEDSAGVLHQFIGDRIGWSHAAIKARWRDWRLSSPPRTATASTMWRARGN